MFHLRWQNGTVDGDGLGFELDDHVVNLETAVFDLGSGADLTGIDAV